MELLTVVTLVYVAVLVLAVAASLILIWIHLRRIGGALSRARAELEAVRDGTGVLESLLEPLRAAPGTIANTLGEINRTLQKADERLARTGGRTWTQRSR